MDCQKALLGFYSHFFEGMLYGNFSESTQKEIELPDHEEDTMRAFVTWIYTGNIRTCNPSVNDPYTNAYPSFKEMSERLWVLGDRLLAPAFTNDSMELLRRRYFSFNLTAMAAGYVYVTTLPESKLRLFVKAVIDHEGPLQNGGENVAEEDLDAWIDELSKGGELAKDCLSAILRQQDSKKSPWGISRFHTYLEPITARSVSDWIKAKQDQNK